MSRLAAAMLTYMLLWLSGIVPLLRAAMALRRTSLVHAVCWAGVAWMGWGLTLFAGDPDKPGWEPHRFLALALTACPVVAVLGARWPYAAAWNFVVLGLLAVMLLPLVEMLVVGSQTLDGLRLFFLAATLALGVLNYLPTRLILFALACGACLALEFLLLAFPDALPEDLPWRSVRAGFLLLPWVAWSSYLWRDHGVAEVDRRWREFRDAYGVVWGQRVLEQFNRAAHHAGWQTRLGWIGFEGEDKNRPEVLETFRALMTRFREQNE